MAHRIAAEVCQVVDTEAAERGRARKLLMRWELWCAADDDPRALSRLLRRARKLLAERAPDPDHRPFDEESWRKELASDASAPTGLHDPMVPRGGARRWSIQRPGVRGPGRVPGQMDRPGGRGDCGWPLAQLEDAVERAGWAAIGRLSETKALRRQQMSELPRFLAPEHTNLSLAIFALSPLVQRAHYRDRSGPRSPHGLYQDLTCALAAWGYDPPVGKPRYAADKARFAEMDALLRAVARWENA